MPVNGANTYNTMIALFEETYSKKGVKDIMPDHCILQRDSDFMEKGLDETGKAYHQPVTVKYPQGWTFWNAGGGAADLNAARAGQSLDAVITANNMLIRDVIDYETAARAVKGKTAFVDATAHIIERLGAAARDQLEKNLLYGQVGFGAVKAGTINTAITIADADWAGGVFVNMVGAPIDFFDVTGATKKGTANITGVDVDGHVITFDTDVSTFASPVVATDILWRSGTKTPGGFNEALGLHAIVLNTGTLFGINAALYPPWKSSNVSAASGNLTYLVSQKLLAKAAIKGGGRGSKYYVNVDGWNNLADNAMGNRRFDASYAKMKIEVGAEEITFYGQTGIVKIVPHPMVRAGYAYLASGKTDYRRIGGADWTFRMPGSDEYLRDMPDNAAYEVRLFTNQALFCERPGASGYVNNIVNT